MARTALNQAWPMATESVAGSSAGSQVVVPAELLDALVEVVVVSPDPSARSAVIRRLVHELCATVQWLHGSDITFDDAADIELASISQLAAAAQDHHWRMSLLGGVVESDTR
jgi:hypothetical protein